MLVLRLVDVTVLWHKVSQAGDLIGSGRDAFRREVLDDCEIE